MILSVALTGTIGAGKSQIGNSFAKLLKAEFIKTDDISRHLMEKGQQGYIIFVQRYGDTYLDCKGDVERKKLRRALTYSAEVKENLEGILHPLIKKEILKISSENKKSCQSSIFEIPLLFEKGWCDLFDLSVAVYADRVVNKKRLMDRDGIDEEYAEKLLNIQMRAEQKAALADVIIDNSKSYEETMVQLVTLTQNVKNILKAKNSKKIH